MRDEGRASWQLQNVQDTGVQFEFNVVAPQHSREELAGPKFKVSAQVINIKQRLRFLEREDAAGRVEANSN